MGKKGPMLQPQNADVFERNSFGSFYQFPSALMISLQLPRSLQAQINS